MFPYLNFVFFCPVVFCSMPGDTCCHAPNSGRTPGIPQHYRASLWCWTFRPSGNERMVSKSVPGRAVKTLAIRVILLHVTAQVMLVDPRSYIGTGARRWGFPTFPGKAGEGVCSILGPSWLFLKQEIPDMQHTLVHCLAHWNKLPKSQIPFWALWGVFTAMKGAAWTVLGWCMGVEGLSWKPGLPKDGCTSFFPTPK